MVAYVLIVQLGKKIYGFYLSLWRWKRCGANVVLMMKTNGGQNRRAISLVYWGNIERMSLVTRDGGKKLHSLISYNEKK